MGSIEFLSCFFPAFNEQENIPGLLDEALEVLPKFAHRFEIIVVDDGSWDTTKSIVDQYSTKHDTIRLESHPVNLGYGQALRTGLRTARGTHVFFTDADRQFSLRDLEALTDLGDVAVAIGYRIKRNDPWHRLVVAKVYHTVLQFVFGLHVKDVDCAFKLVRRDVLEDLASQLESRSAFISPELLIRARNANYEIAEAGVTHYPRAAGRPKGATPKVILRTIVEIFRMRTKLRGL